MPTVKKNTESSRRLLPLVPAAIAVLVLLIYRNALDNPIFADSIQNLTPNLLHNLPPLSGLFTRRWLPFASFSWINWICGDAWFWQNLFNIALHIANAAILFFFTRTLVRRILIKEGSRAPEAMAIATALLFALSPVAPYAVIYLVQRSILLATLFSLIALNFFLNFRITRRQSRAALAVFFYLLAVVSKESAILLPLVMLLLAWIIEPPPPGERKKFFRGMTPILISSIPVAIKALWTSKNLIFAVYEPNAFLFSHESPVGSGHATLFLLNAIQQGALFFRYLSGIVLPRFNALSIDLLTALPPSFISWPESPLCLLFILYPFVWIKMLIASDGRHRLAAFGMLWPWLLYGTEFSVVHVSEVFILYRSYLWLAGPCLALPALIAAACDRMRSPKIAMTLGSFLIFWSGTITSRIIPTFDSPSAIWADAAGKIPDEPRLTYKSHRIWYFLGQSFFFEGRFDESLVAYRKALTIRPKLAEATLNVAYILLRKGDRDGARREFQSIPDRHPSQAQAITNLGAMAVQDGDKSEGADYFAKAIQLNPNLIEPKYNLAILLRQQGRSEEAKRQYADIVRLVPGSQDAADAHLQLAILAIDRKDRLEAKNQIIQALTIVPGWDKALKLQESIEFVFDAKSEK